MPATAVKNADGSVTLPNGVVLSASDVAAAVNAKAAFRPLSILTGSGRRYGHNETVPKCGVWFNKLTGAWTFLDESGRPIPGTSWKAKNLNRAKFTFNMPR